MAKKKRTRRTKAQMEAARAAEAAALSPKPKRKRRTKAQMEAARAAEAAGGAPSTRKRKPSDAVAAVEAEIKADAAKHGHRPGTDKYKSYRRGWLNVAFPR